MDELKGLIRELDADTKSLRASQENETRARQEDKAERARQTKRRDILLGVLIVCVLVASLFIWRIVAQATCSTDRTRALTGPATARVSFIIDAFRASALDANATLPEGERAEVLAELAANRERFPVIPSDKELAEAPASQLLIYLDVIRALDADDDYQAALAEHPVCSFWGV